MVRLGSMNPGFLFNQLRSWQGISGQPRLPVSFGATWRNQISGQWHKVPQQLVPTFTVSFLGEASPTKIDKKERKKRYPYILGPLHSRT